MVSFRLMATRDIRTCFDLFFTLVLTQIGKESQCLETVKHRLGREVSRAEEDSDTASYFVSQRIDSTANFAFIIDGHCDDLIGAARQRM
jgi:hypothetical protein